MEAVETLKGVAVRLVEGMMLHNDLADVFDYLGLRGYKRMQEYYGAWDAITLRKIHRYSVNHEGRILPDDKPVYDPLAAALAGHDRSEASVQERIMYTRRAVEKWVAWQEETLSKMEAAAGALRAYGHIAAACMVEKLVCYTSKELKCAKRLHMELMAVDFDPAYAMQCQGCIHDEYRRKARRMCKEMI